MNLDLAYLPAEDRMRFSVRSQADWLITRRLLLKLLDAWLQKLQTIDLPAVNVPLGQRDIALEHALSLEFDGPHTTQQGPQVTPEAKLLEEVSITVDKVGTQMVMRGAGVMTTLSLTRMQSHMVIEMLAKKARDVQWVDAHQLPHWLGAKS
jgi:hypothetical protein